MENGSQWRVTLQHAFFGDLKVVGTYPTHRKAQRAIRWKETWNDSIFHFYELEEVKDPFRIAAEKELDEFLLENALVV
jgi:hypothetical protein